MRYMNINKVTPGMKIGKDIVDENERMLLRKDMQLTDNMIKLLQKKNVGYLYIDDELTSNVDIEEVIPLNLKNTAINCLKSVNVDKTMEVAKDFVERFLDKQDIPIDIYNNIESDDSIFNHSLAVAEIAVSIARNMGYDNDRLNDLAVSALLHDIGKLCSDKKTMEKFNIEKIFNQMNSTISFAEYQEKMHPYYGFCLLDKNVLVKATVKQGVLAHHENMDGTGTLHIAGNKIYEYARIIHIADAFIQLITDNYPEYRASNTNDVIEYIRDNSNTKFDKYIADIFITRVPIYPPGINVDLSDGRTGIILKNNKNFPTRPKIIIEGSNKEVVDLMLPMYQSLIINGVSDSNKMIIEQGKHL